MIELGVGLAITIFNLKALYGLAVWMDTPPLDLLHEESLARAWTKWRMKHPTFHLSNNHNPLNCAETLKEQKELLRVHGHHVCTDSDFEEQIRGGCAEVHQLLKERFKHLAQIEEMLQTLANMMLYTRPQGRILKGVLFLFKKILKRKAQGTLQEEVLIKLVMSYAKNYRNLVEQILTFIQMTMFAGIKPRPAMGYEGVDVEHKIIKAMLHSNKLNNIKTTEWVWHHSDMKIASEDIMEQVYKQRIFNKKNGIKNFGQYLKGEQ